MVSTLINRLKDYGIIKSFIVIIGCLIGLAGILLTFTLFLLFFLEMFDNRHTAAESLILGIEQISDAVRIPY